MLLVYFNVFGNNKKKTFNLTNNIGCCVSQSKCINVYICTVSCVNPRQFPGFSLKSYPAYFFIAWLKGVGASLPLLTVSGSLRSVQETSSVVWCSEHWRKCGRLQGESSSCTGTSPTFRVTVDYIC